MKRKRPGLYSLRLSSSVGPFCHPWAYHDIFQAVGFFRVESCPTQAVLPLVGLAAEKVIRDRYI
ncbi:MAG: hypothetical protein R6U98_20515 [Pirellulaceae bacterium]